MEFPSTYDTIEYIMLHSSEASRYEQLAEEATELAHAAQKLARYLRGEQPVADDFDINKVKNNLIEEYTDVHLSMDAVGMANDMSMYRLHSGYYINKAYRWAKRLMDKEEKKNE